MSQTKVSRSPEKVKISVSEHLWYVFESHKRGQGGANQFIQEYLQTLAHSMGQGIFETYYKVMGHPEFRQ